MAHNSGPTSSTSLYPFLSKLAHQQHSLAKEHFSVKLTQLLHQQADLLHSLAEQSKSGRILYGEKWIPVSLLNCDTSRQIVKRSMKPNIDSAFDELLDILNQTQMAQNLKELDLLNQELKSLDQPEESTIQHEHLLRMPEQMDSEFCTQNNAQSVVYQENPPSPSESSILSGWEEDDEEEEICSHDDCEVCAPKKIEKNQLEDGSIQELENELNPTLPDPVPNPQNLESNSAHHSASVAQTVPTLVTKIPDSIGSKFSGANDVVSSTSTISSYFVPIGSPQPMASQLEELVRMPEPMDCGFLTQNDAQTLDYQENPPPSPTDSILFGWDKEEEKIYSRDVDCSWERVEAIPNGSVQLEPAIQTPSTLPDPVQTNTSVSSGDQNLFPEVPQIPPPLPKITINPKPKFNVVHIKTVEQAQKLIASVPGLENPFKLQMLQPPLPGLDGGAVGGYVLVPNTSSNANLVSNIISLASSTQPNSGQSTVVPQTVPTLLTKVPDSIGSKSSCPNVVSGSSPTIVSIGSLPEASSLYTKSILFQCDLCKAIFTDHYKCFSHVGAYHFTRSTRPTGYPQDHVKLVDLSQDASFSSTGANTRVLKRKSAD